MPHFLPRYVSNPQNGGSDGVTTEWLKSGNYEVESMGQRHAATLHLKSPFDANNARVKVSALIFQWLPTLKKFLYRATTPLHLLSRRRYPPFSTSTAQPCLVTGGATHLCFSRHAFRKLKSVIFRHHSSSSSSRR